MKRAVSVTLHPDNLLWLKTRVKTIGGRSLSDALDQIITQARAGAGASAAAVRSVAGNARIPRSDAALAEAGAQVRALFRRSARRKKAASATRREKLPSRAAKPRKRA
jgi:pilus assembly protein TadC